MSRQSKTRKRARSERRRARNAMTTPTTQPPLEPERTADTTPDTEARRAWEQKLHSRSANGGNPGMERYAERSMSSAEFSTKRLAP